MTGLAAGPAFQPALVNLGWDRPLAWLAAGLVALGVGYGLGMLGLSRRSPRCSTTGPAITQAASLLLPRVASTPLPAASPGAAPMTGGPAAAHGGQFYVFLMPCLNEELVIARSLQRLLSLPAGNFAVMVIDDGSDDGTAAAVTGVADERVWLLSRKFVIYTEVFQRGRRHLGSVGLGGNGQFVRLSALRSLGPAPWTRSLTEDLDLGVRLAAAGWRNEYCRTAAVHQQGSSRSSG